MLFIYGFIYLFPDTKVVTSEDFDLTPIKINDSERCDAFTDQKQLIVSTYYLVTAATH
jgi:hypothetical protein